MLENKCLRTLYGVRRVVQIRNDSVREGFGSDQSMYERDEESLLT